MIICRLLLFPLTFVLEVLIPIIEEVISTVCDWVSTVIEVIKEVVSKICGWLPWPFNKLCKWVVDLITVFETVWDWVCETVIETIIQYVKYVLYILVYITRWVCIVINFVVKLPTFLLCLLGLSGKRKIKICIKVLTDENGNTLVTPNKITDNINAMKKIYGQCNIDVEIKGIEYIEKSEYLTTTTCNFGGFFSFWHTWFSETACNCCNQVTVFFVDNIVDDNPPYVTTGCAYVGDNWCRVDVQASPITMAHEVGHILLLGHSNDSNNFMSGKEGGTNITKGQCCLMKSSPFITKS